MPGATDLRRQPANDHDRATRRAVDPTERLYQRHRDAIYRRCLRLLRDREAAEDATQETFIRVVRHIHRAPAGDEALAWLYRIATNYCLNVIRDRRHAAQRTADLPIAHAAADPGAGGFVDALSDRTLCRRILASLPEKLRHVAVLRHVGGLYDAEVATALGVARRTVVYRLKEFKRRAARRAPARAACLG